MVRASARLASALVLWTVLPACGDGVSSRLRVEFDVFGLEIGQGDSVVRSFRVLEKRNINSKVRLSVETTAPGFTIEIDPVELSSTQDEAAVTLRVSPDAPLGAHLVSLRAEEEGGGTASDGGFITVTVRSDGPAFGVEIPYPDLALGTPGQSASCNLYVRGVNGFQGEVFLTASAPAQPYVLIAAPEPASVILPRNGNALLTVSLRSLPPEPVVIEVAVTGTGMGWTHSAIVRVSVGGATSSSPER